MAQMDVCELMSRKLEHEGFKEVAKARGTQGENYIHDSNTCRCQASWPSGQEDCRAVLQPQWELANQNPVDPGAPAPKRSQEPLQDHKKSEDTDVVISIHLSTTSTRVAYKYYPGGRLDRFEDISIVRAWPPADRIYCESIPTLLAYNTQPPKWGRLVNRTDQPQISHFAPGIQDYLCSDHASSDLPSNLAGKTAMDYSADFLSRINNFLFGEFFRWYPSPSRRISYIITIVTDSPEAKERTIQAAVNAGIPKNSLTLVSKPDAWAFWCVSTFTSAKLVAGSLLVVCDIGENVFVSLHHARHCHHLNLSRSLPHTESFQNCPCRWENASVKEKIAVHRNSTRGL
jgi:hypothetical protein